VTAVLASGTRPATPTEDALEALREARPVLVTGGPEGASIVLAAALADTAATAWTIRRSSGFLTVALEAARAHELALPPLTRSAPDRPAQTVAVDAADGITTGISAADRARTARVLASPASRAADLRRPGHVVPVIVAAGGVHERARVPEAAVDLCRLAGLPAIGIVAALEPTNPRAATVTRDQIRPVAGELDVPVVDIDEIAAERARRGDGPSVLLDRGPATTVPTDHGPLTAIGYRDGLGGAEHLVLFGGADTPVTVHRECSPALLGGHRCGCQRRLDEDMAAVARGERTVVYLRPIGRWADTAVRPHRGELATTEQVVLEAIVAGLAGPHLPPADPGSAMVDPVTCTSTDS
jgi:3,4-dihydroxy 2-butanone 4-phosphate synthase / GTP cyclohydrolase II